MALTMLQNVIQNDTLSPPPPPYDPKKLAGVYVKCSIIPTICVPMMSSHSSELAQIDRLSLLTTAHDLQGKSAALNVSGRAPQGRC